MRLSTGIFIFFLIASVFGFFAGNTPGPETEKWLFLPLSLAFAVGTFWFWTLVIAGTVILFLSIEDDRWDVGGGAILGFFALLLLFGDFNLIKWSFLNPLGLIFAVVGYLIIGGGTWATLKWTIFAKDKHTEYIAAKNEFLISKGLTPNVDEAVPDEFKEEWLLVSKGFEYENFKKNYHSRNNIPDPDVLNRWEKLVAALKTADNFWLLDSWIRRKKYGTAARNEKKLPDIVWREIDYINKKPIIIRPFVSNYKSKLVTWVELWPISLLHTFVADFVRRAARRVYELLSGFWQNISDRIFRNVQQDF